MRLARPPGASPGPVLRLGMLGPPLLLLVVLEFLLGMALNLFGSLPTGSPLAVLEASPLLDVHVVFGILLLGIAANALRLAVGTRLPRAVLVTALGLASGVAAFGAGMAFAFGSQSAAASYAMSVGFVGLLLEAGYLLRLRPTQGPSVPTPSGSPSEA
jgi:hypothetical protein